MLASKFDDLRAQFAEGKGVIQLLERLYPNIPIQLCQFHQIKTILTYTTKKPKTECGKDLKEFILTLTDKKITENDFIDKFNTLLNKYKEFLKEKSDIELIDKITGEITTIKTKEYKHPRLRSAFRSIKTNLPYLFSYKKQENERLKIPNTTNTCDGKFGVVKNKIKIHRGLKNTRKSRMFDALMF